MKLSLLPLLACPECRGELRFSALEGHPHEHEEIEAGALRCERCRREYPITGAVPRFAGEAALPSGLRRTRRSFGWEWDRYPGSLEEDRGIFLEETQIPEAEWRGKRALDGGCGMGRYSLVALGLGAEVVAFDLSDALLRLVPAARERPGLHVVQGDLFKPPFKPGVFDIIYSQGVIHHTPDTRTAFDRLAPLVKPGGLLSVWVYGSPGSWASFSTNPLRAGRERLASVLPLVWLVVWARRLVSDFVRAFTTRLPVPALYALCYPVTALGAVPVLKYLTFSVHPDFQVRLIENFDWLAPPYQHKHTKEEVRTWFEAAGFSVLGQLRHGVVPKVGFLGKKA